MFQFLSFLFFRDWKNAVFGALVAAVIGFLWQRAEIYEFGVIKNFWFHDLLFIILVVSIVLNFVTITYINSLLVRGREILKEKEKNQKED